MSRGRSKYRTPSSKRTRFKRKYKSVGAMSDVSPGAIRALSGLRSMSRPAIEKMLTNIVAPGVPTKLFLGKSMYDKAPTSKKGKGFSGSSTLAGKIGRGKITSKRQKVNGKWTRFGLEKNGITLATEHRGEATLPNAESIIIGHTSMPSKVCAINMWRAIFKYCLYKMGCQVRDFGILMTNYDFRIGDVFKFVYYDSGVIAVASEIPVTIDAFSTFDSIAARFAAELDDRLNSFDDRIESFLFEPSGTQNHWGGINLKLSNLKIAVGTKSSLKIQNVTVETNADNEADDVTRVPLQGMQYTCKGNNFRRKANNEILDGFYHPTNESTIFKGFTKSDGAQLAGTSVGYYNNSLVVGTPGNSVQTTFFKTSEMPKPHEITNCSTTKKFYIPPGGIRTSVLNTQFEMTLQSYYTLIYTYASTYNPVLQYNEKQGLCNAIFLEKVVGKTATESNSIKIWTETEFRQSTLVFGNASNFTLPITYQEDKA